jgi:copper(I)-binding protein
MRRRHVAAGVICASATPAGNGRISIIRQESAMPFTPFAPFRRIRGWAAAILLGATFACATALLSPAAANEYKAGALQIEGLWSPATPAGAKVGAGYFSVRNGGGDADTLLSIQSDVSAKAEIHQMKVDNGVMTMRPVAGGMAIPARAEVKLAPNGYHVMFMNLKQPFKGGASFKAILTFEKAGEVPVELEVRGKK